MMETLTQILVDWGIPGMFFSAILAGSILPFSSEIVLITLVNLGVSPTALLIAATVGNTIGGMTCYYIGWLGRTDWIEKYFKMKKERTDRMQRFLQGKGALMGFFSFVPFVGGVITVALGLLRSNVWLTLVSMIAGKLLRYVLLLLAIKGVINIAF
jgi:membrane protein YqaA with SNARE-associated domain